MLPILQRKKDQDTNRVILLAPDLIAPNPDQPRQTFDPQGLTELADSVRIHGILQPLTVRRREDGRFELVAGERRLRAAVLCGLTEVPCLVLDITRERSSVLSLIENLQRRDLDFLEEATALERLISTFGLSQEEAAIQVGKSQSAVANKLRLLRLPREVLELLRKNGYTERHARALLRLHGTEALGVVARRIVTEGLNVSRTEALVEETLEALYAPPKPEAPPAPPPVEKTPERRFPRRTSYVIRDVRFFLNTVQHGVSLMQSAGVDAQCSQAEEGDSILLTIRIPKKSS